MSSCVPRPNDPLPGQRQLLGCQVGQNVDRVADDDHDRLRPQPGRDHASEDLAKERDIAADQLESTLLGPAAQASGDDHEIAPGDFVNPARPEGLIGGQRRRVLQIERVPLGQLSIGIDQDDVAHGGTALQGKGRATADQSATTNNARFHPSLSNANQSPPFCYLPASAVMT